MICSQCKSVMSEGDKHSRCELHRKCTRNKPCKLDKDWTVAQWEALQTAREVHKLARSNPIRTASKPKTGIGSSEKALSGSLGRRPELMATSDHNARQVANGAVAQSTLLRSPPPKGLAQSLHSRLALLWRFKVAVARKSCTNPRVFKALTSHCLSRAPELTLNQMMILPVQIKPCQMKILS